MSYTSKLKFFKFFCYANHIYTPYLKAEYFSINLHMWEIISKHLLYFGACLVQAAGRHKKCLLQINRNNESSCNFLPVNFEILWTKVIELHFVVVACIYNRPFVIKLRRYAIFSYTVLVFSFIIFLYYLWYMYYDHSTAPILTLFCIKDGDIYAQEEMLKKQSNGKVNGSASKNIFQLYWGNWFIPLHSWWRSRLWSGRVTELYFLVVLSHDYRIFLTELVKLILVYMFNHVHIQFFLIKF